MLNVIKNQELNIKSKQKMWLNMEIILNIFKFNLKLLENNDYL